MKYPADPGHKDRGASLDAAATIEPKSKTLQRAIMSTWSAAESWTTDEMATRLGESVLAIRPRFTELKLQGKIRKTDRRRKNNSGLSATVWEKPTFKLEFTP